FFGFAHCAQCRRLSGTQPDGYPSALSPYSIYYVDPVVYLIWALCCSLQLLSLWWTFHILKPSQLISEPCPLVGVPETLFVSCSRYRARGTQFTRRSESAGEFYTVNNASRCTIFSSAAP